MIDRPITMHGSEPNRHQPEADRGADHRADVLREQLSMLVHELWLTPIQTDEHLILPESPDDVVALYERLRAVIAADGYPVREFGDDTFEGSIYIREGLDGLAHRNGIIDVRQHLSSRDKAFVLIHEYAHQLLHLKRPGMVLREDEYHAEAVSYVVAAFLGYHNPRSAPYLNWKAGESATVVEKLLTNQAIIVSAADSIVEKVFGTAGC